MDNQDAVGAETIDGLTYVPDPAYPYPFPVPVVDQQVPATEGVGEVAVPATYNVKWSARLVGEHGETLVELGTQAQPLVEHRDAPVAVTQPTVTPPLVVHEPAKPDPDPKVKEPVGGLKTKVEPGQPTLRPLAYGLLGAGLASAAVGTIFAVKLSGEKDQLTNPTVDSRGRIVGLSQKEAADLAQASQRDALLANIFLGTGGALVAGGVGVWVWGGLNPESPGSGGEIGVAGILP